MNLKSKTVVVTGAASGIGAETARQISAAGGRVIAVDRDKPSRETDLFYRVDLLDEGAIDALAADLARHRPDGLANIAGVPPTAGPAAVLSVNFVAVRRLTLALAPHLATGASIVNMASLAGIGWELEVDLLRLVERLSHDQVAAFVEKQAISPAGSYALSKQALIAWTHKNRWTWRDRSIRINAVSPGPVETPILDDFKRTLGARVEEDMRIMDRPGRPEDIAPTICFLLSDSSTWIRGANIPVDGGMRAHIQSVSSGLEESLSS